VFFAAGGALIFLLPETKGEKLVVGQVGNLRADC
jgi:hypothetical protein